jgi:hypothetical protein
MEFGTVCASNLALIITENNSDSVESRFRLYVKICIKKHHHIAIEKFRSTLECKSLAHIPWKLKQCDFGVINPAKSNERLVVWAIKYYQHTNFILSLNICIAEYSVNNLANDWALAISR